MVTPNVSATPEAVAVATLEMRICVGESKLVTVVPAWIPAPVIPKPICSPVVEGSPETIFVPEVVLPVEVAVKLSALASVRFAF
jgi:hypothetical protein